MTTLAFLILVGFAAVLVQRFADAAEPHPFTVHDLLAMERISDPRVSPDGRRVVFVNRVTDLDENKGVNDLWLVNVDGSGLRRLTTHKAGSHSPQWSPDGRQVFFFSTRSGSSQVWRIAPDGGEAEQITDLPLDVEGFKLSPDGVTLVLALEVFPDCATPRETKDRLEEIEKRKSSGRVYDRLFIRHWDTWKDGRRSHLFALRVGDAEPIDLMKGIEADVPGKPFGGMEEVAFTPDGKTLAYLGMKRPGYESDRFRIMLIDWPRDSDSPPSDARDLTENWDRSACDIVWSADGRTIYTHADHLGQHPLFAIDVANGDVRTLVERGKVSNPVVADGVVVFALRHLSSPVELYAIGPDGGEARQITSINARKLANIAFGEDEQFTFKGWNDEDVYCTVVKPADFDPSKKYPVAFLIHGGPQGSFGNDFHYRWNPQVYAAAGYAAVMVDFHGSTGYGQAFTDAINGHWGDRPLEDLQKGLAATLDRYPWMDGERVAALGASYGGYMINWIAGVWPDRFTCLVCHDGNLCERLAYYDTEELWFPEWERGGPEWERSASYQEHNPIDHVANWKTPMLVIHGGNDYRVVDTQGISTFTALQRKGIPSKLLYFPDENHWVLKPHNCIQWHEAVLDWLNRWTTA